MVILDPNQQEDFMSLATVAIGVGDVNILSGNEQNQVGLINYSDDSFNDGCCEEEGGGEQPNECEEQQNDCTA
jgi:hypothetical protein